MDDDALLQQYIGERSEKAFAELVSRHLDLVYSTALRTVQGADLAEDVCQSVFIELARKAASIRSGNTLPGWLYRVTRCQAANAARGDRIRREREMEAMNMTPTETESFNTWQSILPHLDEAMLTLNPDDQNAIVQRFFQGRSWREVGTALGLSEDAAQKRVLRALEKLRGHMERHGAMVSASSLGLAIAAHAVHAAPANLASVVTAVSMSWAGSVGNSSFSTSILKTLLMKKTTIGIIAAFVLVAGVTTPFVLSQAGSNGPVTEKSVQRGLVMHLTFDQDESSNGKVADVSGSGNDGRASGVHWTAEGKKGGAYEFTADGNEIVIANNKSLNPAQLTLAAWIRTSHADDRWRRIFDKSYKLGFALSVAGDWQKNNWRGLVSLEMGPGTHFIVTKAKVDDGQWHLVVSTFDGSVERLYLDGQLQSELTWKKPGVPGPTDFNLVIGCNRSNLDEDDLGMSFRGVIDEPRMWNRALSDQEVGFLYNSENGSPAVAAATN